jgi:hypothetical protein
VFMRRSPAVKVVGNFTRPVDLALAKGLRAANVKLTRDWQAIFRDFLRSSDIWRA